MPKHLVKPVDSAISKGRIQAYAWQEMGWHPFFIEIVRAIDKNILCVKGSLDGNNISMYLRRGKAGRGVQDLISSNILAHARIVSDGHYELSVFHEGLGEKKMHAFSTRIEAYKHKSHSISLSGSDTAKKNKHSNSRREVIKHNQAGNILTVGVASKKDKAGKSVIELAFDKARRK